MVHMFTDSDAVLAFAHHPQNLEEFGRDIALACSAHAPSVVLTLDNSVDCILGHVVARELGVDRATVFVDLGRISTDQPLESAGSALLIGVLPESSGVLSAISVYLKDQGISVIALTLAPALDASPDQSQLTLRITT